jgi:hypothetical protein
VDEEGNLIKTDLSGIRTVKANIPGGKKVTRESGREGGRGRVRGREGGGQEWRAERGKGSARRTCW